MAYGSGGDDTQGVNGKTYFCEVGYVTYAAVDDGAGKTSRGHGGAHQSAHASYIDAVFNGHHINGVCAALIDGGEHSVQGVGIVVGVLFLLDGECEAGEFAPENWAHAVGHVHFVAGDFFHGVGDGGDFDVAIGVEKG